MRSSHCISGQENIFSRKGSTGTAERVLRKRWELCERYELALSEGYLQTRRTAWLRDRYGVPRKSIWRWRRGFTPRHWKTYACSKDPDMGKITDHDMADRYGITYGAAGAIRRLLGIDCKFKKKCNRVREAISDHGGAGQMSDRQLSREVGCSPAAVWRFRQANNIPVFSKEPRKPREIQRKIIKPSNPNWRETVMQGWR